MQVSSFKVCQSMMVGHLSASLQGINLELHLPKQLARELPGICLFTSTSLRLQVHAIKLGYLKFFLHLEIRSNIYVCGCAHVP